jgi:hypothetical protein
MAASNLDKLMEVGIATATTLDANYTINDTSITVASTSGWPTATGVAFAIDVVDSNGVQVPGTYNEYVGVVSSATSITSVDHMNGTDRNYSAGATTRVYIPVTAERENRIVEWGTVQHNQDGTHAAVTATSLATNTISEGSAGSGVTIDGLLLKDSKLATNDSVVTANITNAAVTPAKWTNPYKFAAYRNAALNTVNGTQITVFDTEEYDTNNNYNTSDGKYTAPVDGYYLFSTAFIANSTGQVFSTSFYVNGTEVKRLHETPVAPTGNITIGGSALVYMTAGQYCQVNVFCTAVRGILVGNKAYTYFTGFLVSQT